MADASVREQTSTQLTLTSHRRMLVWEPQAVWDVHVAICVFFAPVAFQSEPKPLECHRAYLHFLRTVLTQKLCALAQLAALSLPLSLVLVERPLERVRQQPRPVESIDPPLFATHTQGAPHFSRICEGFLAPQTAKQRSA